MTRVRVIRTGECGEILRVVGYVNNIYTYLVKLDCGKHVAKSSNLLELENTSINSLVKWEACVWMPEDLKKLMQEGEGFSLVIRLIITITVSFCAFIA